MIQDIEVFEDKNNVFSVVDLKVNRRVGRSDAPFLISSTQRLSYRY